MDDAVYNPSVNVYGTFDAPYDIDSITSRNHINWGMYSYKLVTGTGHY